MTPPPRSDSGPFGLGVLRDNGIVAQATGRASPPSLPAGKPRRLTQAIRSRIYKDAHACAKCAYAPTFDILAWHWKNCLRYNVPPGCTCNRTGPLGVPRPLGAGCSCGGVCDCHTANRIKA